MSTKGSDFGSDNVAYLRNAPKVAIVSGDGVLVQQAFGEVLGISSTKQIEYPTTIIGREYFRNSTDLITNLMC